MVEISGNSPYKHGFPNIVFIVPAIVVIGLVSFFGYKLYKSLMDREMKRENKKKSKQQKKSTPVANAQNSKKEK